MKFYKFFGDLLLGGKTILGFWTMWSVLLTGVSARLCDVFCEIFQGLFSDDLWKRWWAVLRVRAALAGQSVSAW